MGGGDPPPARPHLPPPQPIDGTSPIFVVEAEDVDELEVGHRGGLRYLHRRTWRLEYVTNPPRPSSSLTTRRLACQECFLLSHSSTSLWKSRVSLSLFYRITAYAA